MIWLLCRLLSWLGFWLHDPAAFPLPRGGAVSVCRRCHKAGDTPGELLGLYDEYVPLVRIQYRRDRAVGPLQRFKQA